MKYSLPIRNILKYSLIFTLTVTLISFLGSFMNDETWGLVFYRALNTFIIFYGYCLINLCLLLGFEKKRPLLNYKGSVLNKKHFLVGIFFTFCIFLASHFFNLFLIDKGIVSKSLMREEIKNMGNWLYIFSFAISVVMYGMVYIVHNFFILENWKNQVDLENSRLKSVNADTVNQLLKQQIQPHFLFNALNVLKSLIRKDPDVAEEYLISLSDFLRASVNQNKKTVATLKEELKICTDYMEMQKIRFGNAIDFEIKINEEIISSSEFLPVFSLQPLVENAIKHNGLTNAEPLKIRIQKAGGWIEVTNNLQPKNSLSDSSGNGLSNLSERYRILSGDPIKIQESCSKFSVKIKILNHQEV